MGECVGVRVQIFLLAETKYFFLIFGTTFKEELMLELDDSRLEFTMGLCSFQGKLKRVNHFSTTE